MATRVTQPSDGDDSTQSGKEESSAVEHVEEQEGNFPSDAELVPIPRRYLPVAEVLRRDGNGDKAVATKDFIEKIAELIRQTRHDLNASDTEDKESTGLKAKLSNAFNVINKILEFLEKMGPTMLQNLESSRERDGVAQGILSLIELAHLLELYRILSFLIRTIDVQADPYRAKIKQITEILKEVESHAAEIESLVENAGEILKGIINEGRLLAKSANLFDNAVREARLKISFRRKTLEEAETVIKELRQNASVFKWMSRVVRFACIGISVSFFYEKYKSNAIGPSIALGCSMILTFLILSMFPENAYKLTDTVEDLLVRYKISFEKFKHLEELMESTQSFKDGLNNGN